MPRRRNRQRGRNPGMPGQRGPELPGAPEGRIRIGQITMEGRAPGGGIVAQGISPVNIGGIQITGGGMPKQLARAIGEAARAPPAQPTQPARGPRPGAPQPAPAAAGRPGLRIREGAERELGRAKPTPLREPRVEMGGRSVPPVPQVPAKAAPKPSAAVPAKVSGRTLRKKPQPFKWARNLPAGNLVEEIKLPRGGLKKFRNFSGNFRKIGNNWFLVGKGGFGEVTDNNLANELNAYATVARQDARARLAGVKQQIAEKRGMAQLQRRLEQKIRRFEFPTVFKEN